MEQILGSFETNGDKIVHFNVVMTDIGPFALLPLNDFNIKPITDINEGAVNFMVEITADGPVARIPLLQFHMRKLDYLRKTIHPDSYRSLFYASDPDKIMRFIYMKQPEKIIEEIELGNSMFKQQHIERAIEVNSRECARILVLFGCPYNREQINQMKFLEWYDVISQQ